jgi:myosin-5
MYRLSVLACRYNTETVSPEVLAQMKQAMQQSAESAASHSFLLDDDSAIPFNQGDVEQMVDDKVGRRGEGGSGRVGGCV